MKGSKLYFCVVLLAVSLKLANPMPLENPELSDPVPVTTTESSSVQPDLPADEGNTTRRPETSENKPKEEEGDDDKTDEATPGSPDEDGGDNKKTPSETEESSDIPTETTSDANPDSDQDDVVTNLTSDILGTSVGPIPVSGEEEVTSSSTLKPTNPPASEDLSKDGEAQPDPKPEIEDAKHTVVDEQDQEAQPSVAPGPDHERHFDGWSFFGGILLTVSMLLIGFVLTKYYRVKQGEGRTYNRF